MREKRKAWVEDLPIVVPVPGRPGKFREFFRITIQDQEIPIYKPKSYPLENGGQYHYDDKKALREAVKNIEAAGWNIVISPKIPRLSTFTKKEMTVGMGHFDVEREIE